MVTEPTERIAALPMTTNEHAVNNAARSDTAETYFSITSPQNVESVQVEPPH